MLTPLYLLGTFPSGVYCAYLILTSGQPWFLVGFTPLRLALHDSQGGHTLIQTFFSWLDFILDLALPMLNIAGASFVGVI
jgi:hypothetical protein